MCEEKSCILSATSPSSGHALRPVHSLSQFLFKASDKDQVSLGHIFSLPPAPPEGTGACLCVCLDLATAEFWGSTLHRQLNNPELFASG